MYEDVYQSNQQFKPDESNVVRNYIFDTITCTSPFWMINSGLETIQIYIFLYVVTQIDKKLNENMKKE